MKMTMTQMYFVISSKKEVLLYSKLHYFRTPRAVWEEALDCSHI